MQNQELSPGSQMAHITETVSSFANILIGIIFFTCIVMIVYAGFKYAMSDGDPKQIENAKLQIIYSGVSMMIAMFAFLIIQIFLGVSGTGSETVETEREEIFSGLKATTIIASRTEVLVEEGSGNYFCEIYDSNKERTFFSEVTTQSNAEKVCNSVFVGTPEKIKYKVIEDRNIFIEKEN